MFSSNRFQQICVNCKVRTRLFEDYAAGDLICSECGLVLEERCIDDRPEWRIFNDENSGANPVRVGGPSNPLLRDGGLSTVIGKEECGIQPGSTTLSQLQRRGYTPDRKLRVAFEAIGEMVDRLGLTPSVKDAACELCRDMVEAKAGRGRKPSAMHAACVYIACRLEGVPRTFKEIQACVPDTNIKDTMNCYKIILKSKGSSLQAALNERMLEPGDLLRRYCSSLGLESDTMRAVVQAVDKFLDLRATHHASHKSQNSVAAAGIYLVTEALAEKPQLHEISRVTGVTQAVIRASYTDMYPHRQEMLACVPRTFRERALLCTPMLGHEFS